MAKKKTFGEEYLDAANQQAQIISDANNKLATTVEQEGAKQAKAMADAQTAQSQAMNDAQAAYRKSMDEGLTNFADIVSAQKDRIDQERAEGEQRIQNDQQAARWAGATELAASIANLIGVGGHNAVSQQYKSYSQDWMRKADQDRREHKNRLDNLRTRQDALQQQLAQLRMNDAGQALQAAKAKAAQDYQDRLALIQLQGKNATDAAKLRAEGAIGAGETALKGAQTAASLGLQERGQNISAQQHRDTMELNMAKAGMKKDASGKIVPDKDSAIWKSSQKKSTSGSGNTYYYTDKDGNLAPVQMSASEYDKFVEQSYAKLKDDPEFLKQYKMQTNDLDRKSLIYLYAQQDPERRAVLSQYGDNPERYMQDASEGNTFGDAAALDKILGGSR